jgi:hypothetical protein
MHLLLALPQKKENAFVEGDLAFLDHIQSAAQTSINLLLIFVDGVVIDEK